MGENSQNLGGHEHLSDLGVIRWCVCPCFLWLFANAYIFDPSV